MKIAEQLKDDYGNLIQLWGVFEENTQVLIEEGRGLPKRKITKKLLKTFESLHIANCFLKQTENI